MALLKGLAAGAAGAAAYNLYHEGGGGSGLGGGKDLAGSLFEAFQRRGASQMAEVARMQRQVDDLQAALLKSLHERGQPTIIVNGSGRGTGKTLVVVAAVAGGAVLYLRFVKGWRLSDMMYVTKGALASMQESVNKSLANVRGQVEAAASDMLERLGVVASKADEVLERQEEMGGKLDEVGGAVEGVAGGVAQLQQQVAYSNHAITMLCGAFSEVARRVGLGNGRHVRALDGLVHGAPQHVAGPAAQLHMEGASAGMALQGPEGMVLLDPSTLPAGGTAGAAPGFGLPPDGAPRRVNPAIYSINGGCAVAAVAAAFKAPSSSAPGHMGGARGSAATVIEHDADQQQRAQQHDPSSRWGRSISDVGGGGRGAGASGSGSGSGIGSASGSRRRM